MDLELKGILTSGQNAAMVMLTFLQADCKNSECREELLSLGQEMNHTWDNNFNGLREDLFEDGDLEPDGHLSSSITASFNDIEPSVELHRPIAAAAALHRVADELREIAAQLEHNVVARATQNLSRNIKTSPFEEWKDHLSSEVDRVMRQGMYLNDLPQEKVIMALTLTLVKGVCEQTPCLLRNLFNTALQYVTQARPR